MKKFLIGGISSFAIMAANNAMAAGYTCEELIEYTSCNPGYYLESGGSVCPSGGTLYPNGVCIEEAHMTAGEYDNQSDCEAAWDGTSGGDYRWYAGPVCVLDADDDFYDVEVSYNMTGSAGTSCVECPAGSTCAGGTAGATVCPAGSYCAKAGLSQPSGKCNVGTYSTGGATSASCTSCPATGLKDKSGATVVATTLSAGSTAVSACVIGDKVEFQDDKGIWHYKSTCSYEEVLTVSSEDECDALAEKLADISDFEGTEWNPDIERCYVWGRGISYSVLPQSEAACNKIEGAVWGEDDYNRWDGEVCLCDEVNMLEASVDSTGVSCGYYGI